MRYLRLHKLIESYQINHADLIRNYVFIHYSSFVLVMALIANYVLYWETFSRI